MEVLNFKLIKKMGRGLCCTSIYVTTSHNTVTEPLTPNDEHPLESKTWLLLNAARFTYDGNHKTGSQEVVLSNPEVVPSGNRDNSLTHTALWKVTGKNLLVPLPIGFNPCPGTAE